MTPATEFPTAPDRVVRQHCRARTARRRARLRPRSCARTSPRETRSPRLAARPLAPAHPSTSGLATAVAPIYHRSPASMAQTAATRRRRLRRPVRPGAGHRPTGSRLGGLARPADRPNRSRRCASTSPWVRAILAGEPPPEGETLAVELRVHRVRSPARTSPSTLAGPVPRDAAAGPVSWPTGSCCGPAPPTTWRDVRRPRGWPEAANASARPSTGFTNRRLRPLLRRR